MAAKMPPAPEQVLDAAARAKQREPLLSGMRDRPFEPQSTAVVVIDMINSQLSAECAIGMYENFGISCDYLVERVESMVIPNHQRLLATARGSGATVAFVRMGSYRADAADANPALAPMLREWGAQDGQWACEVIDAIRPVAGDLNLLKTGSGCFTTSALDSHLRNLGIETVLYTGVLTNACVMLTVASGFDLGYRNYLVTDATATHTQRLQNHAEELMGGYLAFNVTTDDCVSRLDTASPVRATP